MAAVRPLLSLLIGVALLLAGSGLLSTLVAVRGGLEGWDDQVIGLIMSAYFGGFFLGTFAAPKLIRRIGHVRSFAFYACLCATVVLLHPIFVEPWTWAALRLLSGVALVGLYTVIESWLNASAAAEQRSRIFALYMAINLFALAAGQWLLGVFSPLLFIPFSLVAILICLAALPVTSSRMVQPDTPASVHLRLPQLYRLAPAASTGALLGGLALGAFWGMSAVYATGIGLDLAGVSALVSVTILGGALLQLPIGRLSDRGDRRTALVFICALAAVLAGLIMISAGANTWVLLSLFFVFGGLLFAVYPVCVAHLLDHLPNEHVLAGCSSLLLLNGIGSAIGPAIAGTLMARLGPQALPAFFVVTLLLLAVVVGGRRLLRQRDRGEPAQFHAMLRTTPSALELLPETDSDEVEA
ncbi:MFS transporter [Lysobacter ciconiae]|uniref:MFS transporter n=1 Tax=Novilysobacter ciconiae TaxID=2781022 RepID=A0A7S6ZTX7_9GAMM|nr:MFS transporter [Lysobacter ciconiae]QOY63925.1 MFS transporter [Lysobacter sp. H21R4]